MYHSYHVSKSTVLLADSIRSRCCCHISYLLSVLLAADDASTLTGISMTGYVDARELLIRYIYDLTAGYLWYTYQVLKHLSLCIKSAGILGQLGT